MMRTVKFDELAELTGWSEKNLRAWVRDEELPEPINGWTGRPRRWSRREVVEWNTARRSGYRGTRAKTGGWVILEATLTARDPWGRVYRARVEWIPEDIADPAMENIGLRKLVHATTDDPPCGWKIARINRVPSHVGPRASSVDGVVISFTEVDDPDHLVPGTFRVIESD